MCVNPLSLTDHRLREGRKWYRGTVTSCWYSWSREKCSNGKMCFRCHGVCRAKGNQHAGFVSSPQWVQGCPVLRLGPFLENFLAIFGFLTGNFVILQIYHFQQRAFEWFLISNDLQLLLISDLQWFLSSYFRRFLTSDFPSDFRNGENSAKVFFHFVGATPRSTDLASFLQRLTKELKPDMVWMSVLLL